ncbi:MAG: hypothetical protein IPG95_00020 [Saprospiraceae bacterium]|nr:hypothetical protein [Saprospiraceae bacterium]
MLHQKIVLTENYRSSQLILNAADAVINNNTERMVNLDAALSKNLIASGISKSYTPYLILMNLNLKNMKSFIYVKKSNYY